MDPENVPAAVDTAPRKKVHVWAAEKGREPWHVVAAVLGGHCSMANLTTEAEFDAAMARVDKLRCG